MKLLLDRYSPEENQTIGKLYLLDNNDSIIAEWDCLELPWKDNKKYVSCIPKGIYKASKHISPRFGQSLWVRDVPNRSEILIHKGNYHSDILGCILIGKGLKDINNDNNIDVIKSRVAVSELMKHLKDVDSILIEII